MVEGVGRGFMRIRLGMKIIELLVEGFWLPRKENEGRWIQVKYKKLSKFCFACGRLGHLLKNCKEDGDE